MMERLLARGAEIGGRAQARQVQRIARQLRIMFGSRSVSIDGAQVRVSGRGIFRRWLTEPSVRFLSGGLK
jgi:hypothetical protein